MTVADDVWEAFDTLSNLAIEVENDVLWKLLEKVEAELEEMDE